MTGYHISIGYLSGGDFDKDEAFQVLKKVALELCHNPHHLVDEAVRFGMRPQTACDYAAAYVNASEEQRGTEDSTLRIIEGERAEGNPPQIMMLAGGAGESRTIKEQIRRAFCRLIMREMHKLEIEVNINVA
jgi:hypothetical protein